MDNDPRDWEGIKHDYVHGDLSLRRIALCHGISERCLTDHAKKGGWVRLVGTKRLTPGRKPRPPGAPPPPRPNADETRRRNLTRRLLEALDAGLTQLEARMAPDASTGAAPLSAADAERDARTLAGLARLYAKLVELDDSARGQGRAAMAENQATEASDDADRLRRDLALRLQRLNQARNP